MTRPIAHFKCKHFDRREIFKRLRVNNWLASIVCSLAIFDTLAIANSAAKPHAGAPDSKAAQCLPDGSGFLRARLNGSLNMELDWANAGTQCSGSIRPDGGLRLRFKGADKSKKGTLVLLFGISGLKEGETGKALPVNVTLIREGTGDFYGTQGDHRCTLDEVRQEPLAGIPLIHRSYRVVARGFCMQPARAIKGSGHVLISRFDFAGRVDFSSDDEESNSDYTVSLRSKPHT